MRELQRRTRLSLLNLSGHARQVNNFLTTACLQIGNEFSSVEALWSQFESVMGRDDEAGVGAGTTTGTTATKTSGGEGGGGGGGAS